MVLRGGQMADLAMPIRGQLIPVNKAIRDEIQGNKSPSTIWRWVTKGMAGVNGERIRLKVWYVGRDPHTTKIEVQKFFEDVTVARLAKLQSTEPELLVATDAELEAAGLL